MTTMTLPLMGSYESIVRRETNSCQDVEHFWHSRDILCLEHRELGENMTDEELQEMIDEAGAPVFTPRCLPRVSASS
jgi:hypothetical protein